MRIKKRKYRHGESDRRDSQKEKSYTKEEKSVEFSIIIPTHNAGRSIENLLSNLITYSKKYNIEIILIDSESTDQTIPIINSFQLKFSRITLVKIRKKDFNHGLTRNDGVRLAKGKYIIFMSQDVSLVNDSFFKFFRNDLKSDSKTVAVFGKHIPYPKTPIIQKIEQQCRFEELDYYANSEPLFQDIINPFTPLSEDSKILWYSLFNTFSCYKSEYLKKNPFSKTNYGEDILMGKNIIDKGLTKVYDPRCIILHSHSLNLFQYLSVQIRDHSFRSKRLNLKAKSKLFLKAKKIIELKENVFKKNFMLIQLGFYYILKMFLYPLYLFRVFD
ncbi:hypothetical protein A3D77_02800 [Candidatus Gottesmanbacteria bacterium RIFCSPHIGHO2_02_FULL_39_11]|uniref:Glycosyltransferase 2-like domain-containing protein n=1 Tax=Candidatus Gottesmanbacteria bacterium RIFCSPHIGHO2_02_FULL_39_11 TaxID=1798382 RepID=A0A1F5ZT52_9BACT|nr:MAG: hypothetical protein A3D77_02800 [Candidatus Gottesmanbacteria bacterium RIFCSPHIGHO2_02_FULL_39_11]